MSVVIDIDECVAGLAAMRRRITETDRDGIGGMNADDSVCIHRVPGSLTGTSPKAVGPEMVSIGPYHRNHNTDELLDLERYKWWSLNRLLKSLSQRLAGPDIAGPDLAGPDLAGLYLEVLFNAANQLVERARSCYRELIPDMPRKQFVEMMVLDGCFIIELFRHGGRNEDVRNDLMLCRTGLISIITGDLLKLENQLPFFVLESLFTLSSDPDNEEDSLQLLALKFFNVSLPSPNEEAVMRSSEFGDVKHLLHLFQLSFSTSLERQKPLPFQIPVRGRRHLPKPLLPPRRGVKSSRLLKCIFRQFYQFCPMFLFAWVRLFSVMFLGPSILYNFGYRVFLADSLFPGRQDMESIQCASKLRSAGIVFKAQKADNFLDIVFKRIWRRLQIPPVTIDDLTITVFINCIALEQSNNYQQVRSIFTTYIAFMSCLVKSSEDVAFLSAHGIIISSFSHTDHDVANLFKVLGEKVNFHKKKSYLSQQFRAIDDYYNSPWANLLRTYFGRPWSFVSFLSALVILALTAGQTVLSILSFKQKRQ